MAAAIRIDHGRHSCADYAVASPAGNSDGASFVFAAQKRAGASAKPRSNPLLRASSSPADAVLFAFAE